MCTLGLSINGAPIVITGKRAFGANHSLMANVHEPELQNLNGMRMIKIKVGWNKDRLRVTQL